MADWHNLILAAEKVHQLAKKNENLVDLSRQQKEHIKMLYAVLLLTSVMGLVMLIVTKRAMHLQILLNERMKVIEQQKQQLEQVNSNKDKLFSILSHDLRSPLNSLAAFMKLLKDHGQSLSHDEVQRLFLKFEEALDNTLRLADNLLTWARLQMGNHYFKVERLNLRELTYDSCRLYRNIAESKNIDVVCQIDDEISTMADRNQISFVIRNLINNAIKFTPPGGQVRVEAKKKNETLVQFTVADTGIGMSSEKIDSLFKAEPQKTSTPGTAGEKGTGLGLMLSFEFLRLNGGRINVKSQPGAGTEFILELPASG